MLLLLTCKCWQANITKETETLPILPPQEPVAAMTKTNARMIVARRTRRASSSAQGNHAIVLLTEEEVEQMLQRIESLAGKNPTSILTFQYLIYLRFLLQLQCLNHIQIYCHEASHWI